MAEPDAPRRLPVGSVWLRRASQDTRVVFEQWLEFYRSSQFCDLTLSGGQSSAAPPVRCHRFLMTAMSGLLQGCLHAEVDWVQIPEVSNAELRVFVNALYDRLRAAPDDGPTSAASPGEVPWLWPTFRIDRSDFRPLPVELPLSGLTSERRGPRRPRRASKSSKATRWAGDWSDEADEPPPPKTRRPRRAARRVSRWVESEGSDPAEPDPAEPDPPIKSESEDQLAETEAWPPELVERRKPGRPKKCPSPPSPDPMGQIDPQLYQNVSGLWARQGQTTVDMVAIQKQCLDGRGTWTIDVTTPGLRMFPSKSKKIRELTTLAGSFHVLCGLVRTEDAGLVAQPLAWTPTDPGSFSEILEPQFHACVASFQAVYGISAAHLLNSRCILNHQDWGGRKPRISNVVDIYKRLWNKCTRADLEKELQAEEVIRAFRVPDQCTHVPLELPYTDWTLTLRPNLPAFQEMVVVSVYDHGIECRKLEVNPSNPTLASFLCMKVLFLVWCGGLAKGKILQNDKIVEAYMKNARIMYRKKTSEKLLATEGELPRPLPTFTCDICGKTITENPHMTEWSMHKRQHMYEFYQCDCHITFKSFADKRRHYDLVHCSGKVDLDPRSRFLQSNQVVIKPANLERFKCMCHDCGEEFSSQSAHDEHASTCNGCVQCAECQLEFSGLAKYFSHMKNMHPRKYDRAKCAFFFSKHPETRIENTKKYNCDQCPKTFHTALEFKTHWAQMHGSDDDRPYKCAECDKSYVTKPKMKYHLLNCHIRSRPFVCRHDGCKSDFNCSGNLYAHEKKVHGRKMGPALSIHKAVTDEEMLQYSFIQGNLP